MFKQSVVILAINAMILSACSTANPGSAPVNSTGGQISSSQSGGTVPKDLGDALNLVIGSDAQPSVYSSYHLEATLDLPNANSDYSAIVSDKTVISADVQGKNIHLFMTDPGASAPSEGYIIGDSEYNMVNGSPQSTIGGVSLSWAFWPLKVVVPYAFGTALHAEKSGADTVDGRTADTYAIDTTKADPSALAVLTAQGGIGFSEAKGTVWIDRQTGGLLKLDLTYVTGISNSDATKSIGDGTGHIQLEISKVGQVTVVSPVQ